MWGARHVKRELTGLTCEFGWTRSERHANINRSITCCILYLDQFGSLVLLMLQNGFFAQASMLAL